MHYTEDIFVGYRYFETFAPEKAAYPFGFGLSYTTFELGEPKAKRTTYRAGDTVSVEVDVTNTGAVDGKEVVQLYASKPNSEVVRAPRELKAFEKVFVKAGKSERVRLTFEVDALAYWDEEQDAWSLEKGDYLLYVGNSSEADKAVRITVK